MTSEFKAIEYFKKFPSDQKRKAASIFFNSYDGSNKAYINDEDNFEIGKFGLTDDGLEDWIEFLQGEDPFYFSDPPKSVQHEVMRKFDDYLYKEFRELQAIKKGFEKPIALLTADEVVKVMRSLRKYQDATRGISEEILPAIEEIVKEELGDSPLQIGTLSRALNGVEKNINNAIDELRFYFVAAKEAEKSFGENKSAQRMTIAHFEQYQRQLVQLAKKSMVVNKQLNNFKSRLPAKIKEMIREDNFSEAKMDAFVRAYDYLKEEIPNYVPIYGSIRMYDKDQPWDSEQNAAAIASLGLDSALLAAAIKTAMMIPGGTAFKVAAAAAQYIITDTAIGAMVGPQIMKGIDKLAHVVWPELDRLEQVEREGFAK